MKAKFRREHKPDQVRRLKTKYYNNNKEIIIQRERKRIIAKFGITLEEYNNLLEQAGDKCCICGRQFLEITGEIGFRHKQAGRLQTKYLDHNHTTGKIRGIICGRCNAGLGCFEDDIEIINRAINYLKSKE